MATPIEDELKARFDIRIYDMIERNPAIINEKWPFNFEDDDLRALQHARDINADYAELTAYELQRLSDADLVRRAKESAKTRRLLDGKDVMGYVMGLEGWSPPAMDADGKPIPGWGQPSEVIFNLGKRLNLFGRGTGEEEYEKFIKTINDYRIRNMGMREQLKSAGLFAALGAPDGPLDGLSAEQQLRISEAREQRRHLLARIERDRARRDAAVAAANAQNAARPVGGIEERLGGRPLVQYRRHGRHRGIYSGQSPSESDERRRRPARERILEELVGRGGQGAEQENAAGTFVGAQQHPKRKRPNAGVVRDGDDKKRQKGGRRRRRNTRRRRRGRSKRRRKTRRKQRRKTRRRRKRRK